MIASFFRWNGRVTLVVVVVAVIVVLATGGIPWTRILVIVGICAVAGAITGLIIRFTVPLEARLRAAEAINPRRGKRLRRIAESRDQSSSGDERDHFTPPG